MNKHLVLVGGGHAHMVTLKNLHSFIARGHKVTVIGPSRYHYYSGMGPGMLSRIYSPDDIRFATEHVVSRQGGNFILDKVVRVNAPERSVDLESGNSINYDILSFNAGSYVPWDMVTGDQSDIFSVKPIETLLAAQKRILELTEQKKIRIGIVGGGPSSLEIGGNIWRLAKDNGKFQPTIQIFAGSELMSRFPAKIRKMAYRSLNKRNIEVVEHDYAREVTSGQVTLASGKSFPADIIFLAVGVKPSTIFKESGLPTGPDGGLLVNKFLQSVGHPEIFGGGDCIYFQDQPLDKVGVYAVRENPILYHNLMASLEGGELQAFDPGGAYLLIFNLGDGRGILGKNALMFDGRLAFMIKDYIDRKFMREFQAMEKER
ncbi:MAG: pyridine nucleotide-disulfide oxidoreductase [Desulfobacterales bacterium SG8_35]|nr:MAG: pyridine nucleotide-disulfide oxidoreductase [Desulfobacterales bacterium SG8_35]